MFMTFSVVALFSGLAAGLSYLWIADSWEPSPSAILFFFASAGVSIISFVIAAGLALFG